MNSMKLLCAAALSAAFLIYAAEPEDSIRRVLTDQQAAWNLGNLEDFMRGYQNSPDTLFIGKSVTKGYAAVLQSYKTRYATKDIMGTLDFSGIEVKQLDQRFAFVTGHFHLARTQAAGGEASGIFSLLFEKKAEGWKVIADHTS